MTVASALVEGAAALGLDVDAKAHSTLADYLTLLEKWNRTHNLTAIRDPSQMVTHHLLDSLATLPHLGSDPALRMIDIGSGGGLPGIPIAIARPGWSVCLIDSSHKKAAFLRQAVIELELRNVEVISQRAESYSPPTLFGVAISRAFSDLPSFAAAAARLLAPGGRLIAMKGVYPHEELQQLSSELRVVAVPELRVPGIEGRRHLVIVEVGVP
jgi:16S rRNA (guanine527-N7)-methyltransferase